MPQKPAYGKGCAGWLLIGLVALVIIVGLVFLQQDELISEMLHESFNATLATARFEEPAAAAVLRLLILRVPSDSSEGDLSEVATLIDKSVADGLVGRQETAQLSMFLLQLIK